MSLKNGRWADAITEKHLYLIVIVSVGSLIFINQFFTQHILYEIEETELARYLTGQQLSLSQQLELLSFRAALDFSYFPELQEQLKAWDEMNSKVLRVDSALSLSNSNSERIKASLDTLSSISNKFYEQIANVSDSNELKESLSSITAIQDEYNLLVEDIFIFLDEENSREIRFLRKLEIVLALISLILLGIEYYFIIKPMINRLREKKEKLEGLNNNMNLILETVAHDIRNPVAGIQGILQILNEEIKNLTSSYVELIDSAFELCGKAQVMIKDLLDVSHYEDELFSLDKEVVSLDSYFRGILRQFQKMADEKSIQLGTEVIPKNLSVNIDKNRFSRVIENLVSNAIKFTDKGKVQIYAEEEEEEILIEIRDTGIGIPDKFKNYIFDRFSKARRPGTKGEKTTGLGMSIAKILVEKHGGRIWLQSQEGMGTTIFISLPKK